MSELLFNELPRPTFRWLRVNHTVSSLAGEDTAVQSIAVEAIKIYFHHYLLVQHY